MLVHEDSFVKLAEATIHIFHQILVEGIQGHGIAHTNTILDAPMETFLSHNEATTLVLELSNLHVQHLQLLFVLVTKIHGFHQGTGRISACHHCIGRDAFKAIEFEIL